MNQFFSESDTSRKDALLAAQQQHPQKLPAYIIEKDFYVTCVLEILYNVIAPTLSARSMEPFIFKGGTSLSKCHMLINRMSEDIDLSFSMELLGKEEVSREPTRGRGKMQDEAKQIDEVAKEFIVAELLPTLEQELLKLDDRIQIVVEQDLPLNIGIHYHSVIEEGAAVTRRVLLETGGLSQNNPVQTVKVTHMLGEIIEDFRADKFEVVALSPERTMLEKMFGVHTNLTQEKPLPKYARHLYDILKLHQQDESWCSNRELFMDHVEFSDIHYKTHQASCDSARTGPLMLCPKSESMVAHYESDWNSMADMFPHSQLPYDFATLIHEVGKIESLINGYFYE